MKATTRPNTPRCVIFDVGGVIITNLKSKAIMSNLLGVGLPVLRERLANAEPAYGSGQITADEFYDRVLPDQSLTQEDRDEIWHHIAASIEVRPRILAIAHSLKQQGIRIAIISDVVPEHSTMFENAGVFKEFNTVVRSYEVGCCKPQPWHGSQKIYEKAIEVLGINPNETLYFDDKSPNTDAAKSVGIDSVQADGTEDEVVATIITALRERGIEVAI